jgi:hypothetical protein
MPASSRTWHQFRATLIWFYQARLIKPYCSHRTTATDSLTTALHAASLLFTADFRDPAHSDVQTGMPARLIIQNPEVLRITSYLIKATSMVFPRINSLIESAASDTPSFPRTDIFNETWLVRLIVDWFANNNATNFPLTFAPNACWFSEALLPSAFLARTRGDSLAESWTHADAIIGHFNIGTTGKADCTLTPNANQFVVIEAKIFSPLSPNVKNADYYDQCARNVACVAETLCRAGHSPDAIDPLAFYVLAPASQIDAGVFATEIQKTSIQHKVKRRVDAYGGFHDSWFTDSFLPLLERIDVQSLSWETVIGHIHAHDPDFGDQIRAYYHKCLEFNGSDSNEKTK